ncbi:MAG: metallophosphoesterase [Anaerolineae bacterium]|nr:metallophosphoesterase [Anaerolineae bacterium]
MRALTKITASLLGAGAVAAAGALAYARWVERLRIEVRRMSAEVDAPGLPADGLRILHMSDMHFAGKGRIERWKIEHTLNLLAGEEIDLLLVTGDLIHDDGGLPAALKLLARLPQPRLGAYACLGNHDYASYSWLGPARVAWREAEPGRELRDASLRTFEMMTRIFRNDKLYLGQEHNDIEALKRALADQGVRVLDNSSVRVTDGDTDIWLAGVDDLMEGQPDVDAALAGAPEPDSDALRILLFHNPDHMLDPRLHSFDLAFGGHVHGGQVLIPLLGALHTQGTHVSRRRTHGWFQYGEAKTYIGRGLGEGVRLRFRCRPEVALIDIMPSDWDRLLPAVSAAHPRAARNGTGAQPARAG